MIDNITLSFKELRNMKRELMIILGVIICVLLYSYLIIGDWNHKPQSQFEYYVFHLIRYVYYLIPALFLYSVYRSETNTNAPQNDNPQYLHNRILIMYLLYVEMLIIMAVVFLVYAVISNYDNFGNYFAQLFTESIMAILWRISGPFILLSILCTARGIMFYVQRYKYIVGVAIVSVIMLVYHALMNKIGELRISNLDKTIYLSFFTILLGSIFCAVGIKLIKKSNTPAHAIND